MKIVHQWLHVWLFQDALNSAAAIQKENDTMFQKIKTCVETTDKELVVRIRCLVR